MGVWRLAKLASASALLLPALPLGTPAGASSRLGGEEEASEVLADVLAELRSLREEQAVLRSRLERCACSSSSPTDDAAGTGAEADGKDETEARNEGQVWASDAEGGIDSQDGEQLVRVDVQNRDWMKEVLFGGEPWLLHCSDARVSALEPPEVLQDAAIELKSMATFGLVDCWERMASGKTLAHRFNFPKPPITFAVANGDPPVLIDLQGMARPWQVKRKAGQYLAATIERIDGPERFKQYCTSRRACLVLGFKTAPWLAEAMRTLLPLLEKQRGVRAVAVDTSVWKVKLDEKLAVTRPKKTGANGRSEQRADILCLARQQSNARAGAFFRASKGLDPEALVEFMQRCADARSLVDFAKSPQLLTRPPEKPKYTSPAKTSTAKGQAQSSASTRTRAKKPLKKGRSDVVGSRQGLDDEEPAVVALDVVEAETQEEDEEEQWEEVEL